MEMWVNLFRTSEGAVFAGMVFDTEQEARKNAQYVLGKSYINHEYIGPRSVQVPPKMKSEVIDGVASF